MLEIPTPSEAAQTWLEYHIIGLDPKQTLCPPLRTISNDYRLPNNRIDWDRFKTVIPITDLTSCDSESPQTLQIVRDLYIRHLEATSAGTAPVSHLLIMPDFDSSNEFFLFIDRLQTAAGNFLANENDSLARDLFLREKLFRSLSPEDMLIMLNLNSDPHAVATNVVRGTFAPVPFFAKPVSEELVRGIYDLRRGPAYRYQYMAQSPYNLIQLIDALSAILHRPKNLQVAYNHNTELAQNTDQQTVNQLMLDIRAGVIR